MGKQSGHHLGSSGTATWSFSHVMTGEGKPSIRHSNRAMPFSSTVCDSGCWKKRAKAGKRRKQGKLGTQVPAEKCKPGMEHKLREGCTLKWAWTAISPLLIPYKAPSSPRKVTEMFQPANLLLISFYPWRQQCERRQTTSWFCQLLF